jgi:agmatinase
VDELPRVSTGRAVGPVDDGAPGPVVPGTVVPGCAGPGFAGLATFARLPTLRQARRAHAVIAGVPFDAGASVRPGARFGPAHVRQSSRLLRPYNPVAGIAAFGERQVADAGDIACSPFDLGAATAQITSAARSLTEGGRRLLAIGGDHTIALPLLRVVHERYGPVAVLHFDGHRDRGDPDGATFRQAAEEGLIDRRHSLHVGIRGPLPAEGELGDAGRIGFAAIRCAEIERDGLVDAIGRMRERLGHAPVYVSVDIDVLDPGNGDPGHGDPGHGDPGHGDPGHGDPGHGDPGHGGGGGRLTGGELLAMLRALDRVVGADIVEVTPAFDRAEVTGIAAANVAYELLSILAKDG